MLHPIVFHGGISLLCWVLVQERVRKQSTTCVALRVLQSVREVQGRLVSGLGLRLGKEKIQCIVVRRAVPVIKSTTVSTDPLPNLSLASCHPLLGSISVRARIRARARGVRARISIRARGISTCAELEQPYKCDRRVDDSEARHHKNEVSMLDVELDLGARVAN